MPHLPNAEMVAKAWILGVEGVPANKVATKLPEDQDQFREGFVVITSMPGSDPEMYLLKRRSMIDVEAWAAPRSAGSDKPQWNLAADLCEDIVKACYSDDVFWIQRTLTMPDGFYDARVTSVMPSEPSRRGSDEDSNACFGFDLEMHWITLP